VERFALAASFTAAAECFPQCAHEQACARFEVLQMIRRVLDGFPSASEASRVEIGR